MTEGSGIFEQDWLCSTVRPKPVFCSQSDGSNLSEQDAAASERVAIEGVDLYGLKMAYYCVSEKSYHRGAETVDPLFGEQQMRTVDRAFWFMGYVSQLPPSVRAYQLQGIWGEDVVQVLTGTASFKHFSTYSGSDRNAELVRDPLPGARVGDLVYLPNNGIMYQIVDVKLWEETFGTSSRYTCLTLRVYKDDKMTVSSDSTIPADDPIRKICSSSLESDRPVDDCLKIDPSVDEEHVDLFDWQYEFSEEDGDAL